MPRFSIIVPSYGNAAYLPSALNSVLDQSFSDWEIIIVDDASTDGSLDIAREYAHADSRIRLVENSINQGLHLTRKIGVESCVGEYVLFLDPDDEMVEGGLEDLSRRLSGVQDSILHFGMAIVPCADVSAETAELFSEAANAPFGILSGIDILEASFSPAFGYVHDWRVSQRAFPSRLLKTAFEHMVDDRLERAEDSYEYFVIASMARLEETANDIVAYRYYLGRGVTGSSALSADSFIAVARRFRDCYDAACKYSSDKNKRIRLCANGLRDKLVEAVANEWHERVHDEEKIEAGKRLAEVIGDVPTAAHIMRFVRDEAYSMIANGHESGRYRKLLAWKHLAESLVQEEKSDLGTYKLYARVADCHLKQLAARVGLEEDSRKDIRIFVCTHKDAEYFESDILQPIQVGSSLASFRLGGVFHDDRGDNISSLNPMYCELTAQYWAWKNVDAEYYGFCHYRRYFNFSAKRYAESAFGEVIGKYIDGSAQKKYCLDDGSIESLVRQYDVITTEIKDLRKFPGDVGTPREQYHAAPRLVDSDLERVIGILKEMHPEYAQDADAFLDGNYSCFCNMFIMRKSIFFDYCAWLFPILEEFVSQTDMSRYSKEALRTPGHLSERLFNIFYQHHVRMGDGWRTKQLQCVRFEQPERVYDLLPPSDSGLMPIVPVVFAADGNYVPMLATTIHSMLANASSDYYYDIVVLERGISDEDMRVMCEVYEKPGKVSLRFYDVRRVIESFDLSTNNAHISIETYYRFLIQELLPHYDKVLYLDSDLIVQGDVAQLFETDLGDSLLAAVRDIDFLGNLNMKDGKRMQYAKAVLEMSDPYSYFQAGVLVFNTAAMRELHSIEEWLRFASDSRYIYNDQDILNAECEGRVVFLDDGWNVMTDCAGRIANVFTFAPAPVYEAYAKARECQKIIHYAGFEKPWKTKGCDMSSLYWRYARETPFYERMIRLFCLSAGEDDSSSFDDHELAIGENNPLRRVVDPLLPLGSRRREAIKGIVRTVRGKK